MKTISFIFIILLPLSIRAEEMDQLKRNKSEWYQHFDQRLSALEEQLQYDIEIMHQNQEKLNKEMIRLNEKLENRFDKYFLWGYGTLLVVISTLVNVVFNKRKKEKEDSAAHLE